MGGDSSTRIQPVSIVESDQRRCGQYCMDVLLQRQEIRKHTVILSLPGPVVFYTTHHNRRAPIPLATVQLSLRVPVQTMYTRVRFERMILLEQRSRIDNAQKLLPRLRVNPEIDTEQFAGNDFTARFFQRFTNGGLFGSFSGFDVTARLSDDDNPSRSFLNDKETAFSLDESGYCQVSRKHSGRLNAQLAKFDFDFARQPDFVEHRTVHFGDRGLISIGNTL